MATILSNKFHKNLSALFELRSMLREMEHEIGFDSLSQVELDVFLAAHALSGEREEVVTSDDIRNHDLTAGIAQASYHRALRSLISMGLLEKADGYKSRHYLVRSHPAGS
ncbi:hypothetical protein [Boseongicola aestuarii]|uniref:MarR family protein n=1 Tax=Boseongicola aestuarii TaxID=1470561 RepID=A0A238J6N5_9RHOB|nr:hypothetical protein [Boseongicola aestuarii]SMX25620.1 hypothetical protein BOA8489_03764 [Boseongicola aestuarii]